MDNHYKTQTFKVRQNFLCEKKLFTSGSQELSGHVNNPTLLPSS